MKALVVGTGAREHAIILALRSEEVSHAIYAAPGNAGIARDAAGRALGNIDASLARGLRVFDAAVGGLGGCPYAPGAKGNVATEKVAAHLERLGHRTGLDMGVTSPVREYQPVVHRLRLSASP